MYWFQRPPYARIAVAIALLSAALWSEFRPPASEPHLVAISDIPAGTALTDELFSTTLLPIGSLPLVSAAGTTQTAIGAGEVLRPSDIATDSVDVPQGWWTIVIPLEQAAMPGDQALLILNLDTELVIEGIVVRSGEDRSNAFGFSESTAVVAVPPEAAGPVAQAVANHQIVALVRDQ